MRRREFVVAVSGLIAMVSDGPLAAMAQHSISCSSDDGSATTAQWTREAAYR